MSDLPEGWAECPLSELLEPERGLFDGPFGSSLKTADYVDEGVRVIRLENVSTYEFVGSKRTWISSEKFEGLRKHEVVEGDLIVGSFVDERVRVCLVPALDTPAIAKADCFCLRPLDAVVDRRFLMYQLGLPSTRDALLADIHGATRPRITTKQLKELRVKLPPLSEQRLIVKKVEALLVTSSSASRHLRHAATALEQLEESLSNAAADGSLVSEELRPSRSRVIDVLEEPLANGRSVVDDPSGFPVLRLNAITLRGLDLAQRKRGAWTAEQASRFVIRRDDFLVVRGNGSLKLVGRGALVSDVPDPVAYPDTLIRVRTNRKEVQPRFLAIIWNSRMVRDQIESKARTTAGIHKINQRDLERIEIPRFDPDVQSAIVRRHEEIVRSSDVAAKLIRCAESRAEKGVRSILTEAFAGELVPTEAELARREGRSYESASVLLERIRAERKRDRPAAARRSRSAVQF